MTRKSTNKDIIDTSFLDSSDDYDERYFSNWKLYDSSGDDSFKNKSEILWSRDNDYFQEKDCFQDMFDSFSDVTEGTISSCSWHNDEFDMRSTSKVKASLEAIDDLLYENKESSSINQDIVKECREWADKFPYFRLKGKQLIKPVEDGVCLYSSPSQNSMSLPSENSPGLQIEGKKVVIHTPDRILKKTAFDNTIDNACKIPDYYEELIENNGEYEECFAVDQSKICDETISVMHNGEAIAAANVVKTIHEKVVEKLALEIWPHVLNVLQKVDDIKKYDETIDFQLPPIVSLVEQQKSSLCQRPRTEGNILSSTEFPKLSSILSVSPKVLQKKVYGSGMCMQKKRPTSEMSLFRRNQTVVTMNAKNDDSATNLNMHCPKTQIIIPGQSKFTSLKEIRKSGRENESACLYLPALDEDFNSASDILRGFHIEPETKEVSSRNIPSARFSEISSFTRKSDCFLPPIDDKEHIASNVKLTRNLFTFYGSSYTSDKNRHTGSALRKHVGSDSRPNTSSAKKVAREHGHLEKSMKDVNIANSNEKKCVENVYHQNLSKMSMNAEEEKDAEKSVNLFPIVTSLVPYKEKSYATVKKGIFHAFVGRKR
ncbi:uncharacterized protein LOC129224427 [Uloborus diversus]|uniref:uncharacterized protein LOC129224427 n=1 Tax=Uloborus diversus TaxID=327109 RepID=UPI002409C8D5|nr:uncharacterized protein LOC129224427 [Uloborus diversus]